MSPRVLISFFFRFLTLPIILGATTLPSSAQDTDGAPITFMHGLNQPEYDQVSSETLGRDFHVYIRLPAGYHETEAKYPVVYLLDGGATFPILGGYYNYLSFAGDVPNMIVIGISYGSNTLEGGNFRSTDYTAASPERRYWGGAPKFQTFLTTELLPKMEEKYRIDTARRIIFGQSLGGQFVLYTALTKPDLFWGHIASNPALHRNLPFFLNFTPVEESSNSMLFVSLAENDEERFKVPANIWVNAWQAKSTKPWIFNTKTLEGENHFSAVTGSFRNGLKWMFSEHTNDTTP
ncbi:alpha/beta hydrolase [Kordiimonas aquimaris]|uniref:alpha/beta hydrolase n=1 Tax=Kordiimonas aquimaris TaxID=707591 RepID=UPI0021D07807|nr:alpha/beta hydrolase-fold protein [Kordiimonas aquimaris]